MPELVVDPQTGNVLVLHRRSIGIGTILFFLALASFITAKYVSDETLKEGFYSFGSLCCTLLIVVLIWRCCSCCCERRVQSSGYIVVQSNQTGLNAQTTTYQVPAGSYPPQSGAPPAMGQPQPAYNPNAPPYDAPPSYADAVAIQVKQ